MTERQRSNYGVQPESPTAACTAIRVGHRVIVGGVGPEWQDGHCDPDPEVQTKRCLETIAGALEELGSGVDDIVRTYIWQRHPFDAPAISRAHAAVLGHVRPAITQVLVPGFVDPRWAVQVEAEAVVGGKPECISLDSYPAYLESERKTGWSRAIKVDNRVLVSCTAPIWPDGPDGLCDPDPTVQFNRCMEVIDRALEAGAARRDQVVRTHLWLRDAGDGAPTAKAHLAAFGDILPASTQVCVQGYLRPQWRVELEAEADLTPDRRTLMYFLPRDRPGNMGMSRGVRVGNRVLVSCCAPRWPEGTTGVATHDPLVQARRCWEIILGALHEGDADIEHVTRVRMFIRHAADAEPMARFTHEVFGEHRPALTVLPIRGYLRPEWRVEMEAEAII